MNMQEAERAIEYRDSVRAKKTTIRKCDRFIAS
jgi:hypothetical protein